MIAITVRLCFQFGISELNLNWISVGKYTMGAMKGGVRGGMGSSLSTLVSMQSWLLHYLFIEVTNKTGYRVNG